MIVMDCKHQQKTELYWVFFPSLKENNKSYFSWGLTGISAYQNQRTVLTDKTSLKRVK